MLLLWSKKGAVIRGISDIGALGTPRKGSGSGSDLIIVGRIIPSTEPARQGIVEDSCIGEVRACIFEVE